MLRYFFASILFFARACVLDAQDSACSQWFNNVCLSFCSDAQGLAGTSGLTCFQASNTSLENPARIVTCFNAPAEQAGRMPQVLLCLPQGLCTAGITVYKLVGNNFQPVLRNGSIYLGDNRDTPCDLCEDPNRYLTLHDNYANLTGRYYAQLSYQCCGAEPISFAFYYEIVDGVSSADMTLGYTASTQIENLNGDPVIDGYLPYNGAVPGPALGPFSSGVRLTIPSGSVGGPSQYTVSLYSITCGYVGNGTLLHATTVPVTPNKPFEYKFNQIPNWSNIFEPNGCYKVTVSGQGTCGTITQTGFFSLTSECISCRPSTDERSMETTTDQAVEIYPNPSNGTFQLVGTLSRDVMVQMLSLTGQLLAEYHLIAGNTWVEMEVPNQPDNQMVLVKISDGSQTTLKKHQLVRR